jgi:hypothetical protein
VVPPGSFAATMQCVDLENEVYEQKGKRFKSVSKYTCRKSNLLVFSLT